MQLLRNGPRLALVMAICLSALACKDDGPALPADHEPAGVVIAVDGTVELQREGGASQALNVGDRVKGPDIVMTSPNASVTIQLFHNRAHWGMGGDKRKRVKESEAWGLPLDTSKPLLGGEVDDDVTSAAGRHAGRDSADTRATAMAPAGDKASESGLDERRVVAQNGDDGAATAKASDVKPAEKALKDSPSDDLNKPKEGGDKPDDKFAGSVETAVGGGAVQAAAVPPDTTSPDGENDKRAQPVQLQLGKTTNKTRQPRSMAPKKIDSPDPVSAIRKAIESKLGAIAKCVKSGPAKPVEIQLTLVIEPSGKVTRASAQSANKQLNRCAEKSLQRLKVKDIKLTRPLTIDQVLIWPGR